MIKKRKRVGSDDEIVIIEESTHCHVTENKNERILFLLVVLFLLPVFLIEYNLRSGNDVCQNTLEDIAACHVLGLLNSQHGMCSPKTKPFSSPPATHS